MIKKLLLPLFVLVAMAGYSQLGNSWIDYSKTYYKFKVGKDGISRISQPVIAAAGLGGTQVQHFQLWRNGQQVRMFTSVSTGAMGAADYLEFWGEANDGKKEKDLYRDIDFQLQENFSLFSDTSAYFLTINTTSANLRYGNGVVLPPGAMTADPYFMRRYEVHYKNLQNRGYAAVLGEYVYSSSFDSGEGWTSGDVFPCCALSVDMDKMNVYQAGPPNSVSVSVGAAGNALNARNLQMKFYNNVVLDEAMPYFNYIKKTVNNLSLSLLQSPTNLPVQINGTSSNPTDRVVVSDFSVTYPARFDFNNTKSWYFELAASASGNYLVIDNFDHGGVAPVLYDINNGLRYTCDISTPGKVKIVLPPSADAVRKFNMISVAAASISNIAALTSKTFTNFGQAANQGTYIIISSPLLYDNGSGVNFVEQYRQYRSSIAGGSFNTKTISIGELIDQFGYGVKNNPVAIRDFIRYANQQFTIKPKYVFIIGRGIAYPDYKINEANPLTDRMDLVPTFGWPASDNMLACEPGTFVPLVPIGRLAAVSGTEVSQYLEKIKQYEQAQQSPVQSLQDKAWMKNFMHVVGGKDSSENAIFKTYMRQYKIVAEDTLYGAKVETFEKASVAAVQQAQSQRIDELFQEGLSFIGYFGHSSANLLEFNLSSPEVYQNQGKYPFFNVSGCSAGNFFVFDPLRMNGNLSLSEKYVLANQRGSIGFLASTHLGVPPFLNFYNTDLYNEFCINQYGNSVGNQIKTVLQTLGGNPSSLDFLTRIHLEELTLHGDPAIKINSFAAPDYAVEDKLVKLSPAIISVADNNFTASVKVMNIGKAVGDSIRLTIKRKLPNDSIKVLYNQVIPGIRYIDSVSLTVPINPLTDKGLNKLIVHIDVDNKVSELSEVNNILEKDFFIFEDELRPVFPYNYSIINQQNLNFIASTANPLNTSRQYVMELDTTELFNSAFKKTYNASGVGGIVQFAANNVTFGDSTVYYWRTAMVPINPGGNYIWNPSSFIYLANSTPGFNQSHFFQFQKNSYDKIQLDADRQMRFKSVPRSLIIRNGIYPNYSFDRINVNLDFDQVEFWGCVFTNLQVYVFDSTSLQAWDNVNQGAGGRFGSWPVCNAPRKFFEFPFDNPTYRRNLMKFLEDSIPNGMYVAIKNLNTTGNTSFINQWKNDTLSLGSGKSLYHTLKNIGFTQIDSFYKNRPFVYFYRKNFNGFTPEQHVGADDISFLDVTIPLLTRFNQGTVESPAFGPASKWNELHWRGKTVDAGPSDTSQVEVYGIKTNGTVDKLATVSPARDTNLAFINAATYPYLKLKMLNKDVLYATPEQLRYWRLNATYVPEGAIAPNISFKMKDTVEQGESIDFAVAFKNISQTAFDSLLKVKFIITDRNNVPNPVIIPKRKALIAGDTLMITYSIDTRNFSGDNTLFVDVNPDNDQLEQYHYNNVLYKNFFVKPDKYNPLLDVTFDGVHILNRDIVSSKPRILVKLKDESRFLLLKDTALLKVQVRFPDQSIRTYRFGDTMRFTPASLSGGDNTASIDFGPYFPQDGEYELLVSGKDVVGNRAGELDYRVNFSVINKPMISNLLNYPNPFTTSTAFVFTITGTEPPQNMRIQILTITGKVVREITKQELGDIHVGRNITSFKWDGTDMYGQKLANGVYLYRVITNLNGKSLDKYTADGDKTDKYFNKGYGKMYLMR
jgi:Peptidase family C25/FlgD Ig-like domain/CARDB